MTQEDNNLQLLIKQARIQFWEETGRMPTMNDLMLEVTHQEMIL